MCTVKCYANPGPGRVTTVIISTCILSRGSLNLQVLNIVSFRFKVNWKFCDKLQHRIIAVVYMSSHIMEDSKYTQIAGMASRQYYTFLLMANTIWKLYASLKQNPDDILDCQLRKMKILQALAVLYGHLEQNMCWRFKMHSLDSVKYVNKFDKEIPQYFVCRMWFFNDIFWMVLVFIVDGCRR